HQYDLTSFFAKVGVDKEKPTRPSDKAFFLGNTSLYAFDLELAGNLKDGALEDLDIAGDVTLAVGDQTPDGNGEWKAGVSKVDAHLTTGFVRANENGIFFPGDGSLTVTVSGNFRIGPLQIEAQDLTLAFHGDHSDPSKSFFLIGGTLTLPQLKN